MFEWHTFLSMAYLQKKKLDYVGMSIFKYFDYSILSIHIHYYI